VIDLPAYARERVGVVSRRSDRRVTEVARSAALIALLVAGSGCASRHPMGGVPIDQRPTPPAPTDFEGAASDSSRGTGAASGRGEGNAPVEAVMSAEERRAAHQRIIADTTAAGSAVARCGTRTLLPDQESVLETTRTYLVQARAALQRNDLWQAESLARKARQLSLSLDCR
jgi:hypothetical protein